METIKGFISIFMSAVSNSQLYSGEHTFIEELTEKAFEILTEFLKGSDNFEMMIIENDLVINKSSAREIGAQGANLIKRLKRKGITHIVFLKGISLSELKQLIAAISSTEQEIKSSPHMKIGAVDVHIGTFKIDRNPGIEKTLSHFTPEQIEKVKKEYNRISPFKKLHIAGFEEIVVQFVMSLKKEMNILKLLRPVESYTGNDYIHAANVAALTVFQARTIGMKEDFLHDIGIAALLHDVGKLFVPGELLNKESSLREKESEAMKLHPLYGAQYLAKIDGLTHLAPIVAFEHHLRYDGLGYPELKLNKTKQHICSQMTAISDAFDTLRSTLPGKRALHIKDALIKMKIEDEGLFNPFLIDNFIRSMHLALSG